MGLTGAFGDGPSRGPPSPASVAALRSAVVVALQLEPAATEPTNAGSPLRGAIVQAVGSRCGDPDVFLGQWLREGAPMGIEQPIPPGGLFPPAERPAATTPEAFAASYEQLPNHLSFGRDVAAAHGPAADLVTKAVDAGFGRLFEYTSAAERQLGGHLHTSPLGGRAEGQGRRRGEAPRHPGPQGILG